MRIFWLLCPWTPAYLYNGCGPLQPLIVNYLPQVIWIVQLCAVSCHKGHCALKGELYQVLKSALV